LAGAAKIEALAKAHVLLFGLGGVGSFAAEALARSGLGKLSLVEYDLVIHSNRNRQLPALSSTVGREKLEVCAARLRDINPALELALNPFKMTQENLPEILQAGRPDFIADAIDDLPAKVQLIVTARNGEIPIISAMGAGYRLDMTQLAIGDIRETHTCPLARRLRRSLKEQGITEGLPVVWSKESPRPDQAPPENLDPVGPASMIFVPAAAGLLMASYIVEHL
jgi:tRNA A37 threonylcarbamoyladenosine dehydratase